MIKTWDVTYIDEEGYEQIRCIHAESVWYAMRQVIELECVEQVIKVELVMEQQD